MSLIIEWYPIDGETFGYKGDIVLRHENGVHHIAHSNWIGRQMSVDYGRNGEKAPAYIGTRESGWTHWLPLGE